MGFRSGSGVGPFFPLTHYIPSSPLPGTPTPLLNCVTPLSHHFSNESLPSVYRPASLSAAFKKKKVLFTLKLTQTMTTSLACPFSSRTGQQLSQSPPSPGCRLPPTGFSSPLGSRQRVGRGHGRPDGCQIQRSKVNSQPSPQEHSWHSRGSCTLFLHRLVY